MNCTIMDILLDLSKAVILSYEMVLSIAQCVASNSHVLSKININVSTYGGLGAKICGTQLNP